MYLARISSSSLVHLPFFNPTFSQHGALPILLTSRGFSVWERRGQESEEEEETQEEKEITTATARNAASSLLRASPALWSGLAEKGRPLLGVLLIRTHIYTHPAEHTKKIRWVF
jgi:hypothetical protein